MEGQKDGDKRPRSPPTLNLVLDNAAINGVKVYIGKGSGLEKCGIRKYRIDIIEVVGKDKMEVQSWNFRQ